MAMMEMTTRSSIRVKPLVMGFFFMDDVRLCRDVLAVGLLCYVGAGEAG
jgi:hypothetical protein